ncbi:Sensor histidine kinase [Bifidobacterium lemurum]|uniref:histidine kinase n=2 Tax=Bifidobacterium lemurum TaxID=1603886 RepID=A0A261FU13_9BIFI|nr:Sensor histidine kinase [Bifidobacterium lemurum]
MLFFSILAMVFDGYAIIIARLTRPINTEDWCWFCIYMLLCSLLSKFPRFSSSAIILLLSVLCLFPDLGDNQYMFAGIIITFGIFAYTMSILAVGIISALTAAILFFSEIYYEKTLSAALVTVPIYLIAIVVGYTCKLNREISLAREQNAKKEAELHAQLHIYQRNLRLARNLHDTVANNLSYIISIADAQEGPMWRNISTKANESFDTTHEVIRLLHDTNAKPALFQGTIHSLIQQQRAELEQLDIHGYYEVDQFNENILAEEIRHEMAQLIGEIFKNVSKHADTVHKEFLFILRCRPLMVELIQMNTVSPTAHPLSRGHGLALHREIIQALGGSLTTQTEDNTWTLHAVFPIDGHPSESTALEHTAQQR